MTRLVVLVAIGVPCALAQALHGTITDPSGAAVPGAVVQLRGPGGEQRARTGDLGEYSFSRLTPGVYDLRVAASGFSLAERKKFAIERAMTFDAQLVIEPGKQIVNVDDALGRVTADPESNASAVVMRERELAALSDDPDELALQLQALAGPAPGPDGGQVFVDGFNVGNLPPKSAIREIRINANPFSPEYDRPGFGRIEIFTKPGSDAVHGQAFAQYNDDRLNTRNPLLTQNGRVPFRAQLYGLNLGGPLVKNRASFGIDLDHRRIAENAFIQATVLDASGNPARINQALPAPFERTNIAPRFDFAINPKHTLVARYQDLRNTSENQNVGDFSLASRATNAVETERLAQLTETGTLSAKLVNETRFQFAHSAVTNRALSTAPSINVVGAFAGGGAPVGNSGSATNSWELTNLTIYTAGRHTVKWGGRVRQAHLTDTSFFNFAGTFTFYSLDAYRAGQPAQFSLNAGKPATHVDQADLGLFVNDDWRLHPNLTLSFGARYEVQTNRGDLADWAPRVGIAWGLDGHGKTPAKTVVRAGAGTFFDRIPIATTLNALRFDGATQRSFLILNPGSFPAAPPLDANQSPQLLRPVFGAIRAPRQYQTSLGIERQLDRTSRISLTWIDTRGVHLFNVRNVNTPISGAYPFADRSLRLLTESAGLSRLNQLVLNTNINRKKVLVFGFYSLSYGSANNEGVPADPYDLRAEWGPSSYGDVRHRAGFGGTFPLWLKFSASPFVAANSGVPYNITTGLDPNLTGFPAMRPALLAGVAAAQCHGASLEFAPAFGCFDLNPARGVATIGRNFARGPAAFNIGLRIARTWAFGPEGRSGVTSSGDSHGPPQNATPSGHRYNVTLSASTLNALNHVNFAPPNGDLSSPYFGQARALGGLAVMLHGGVPSTYNRKIDLQVRFTF